MKLSKRQLKKIIREEKLVLQEMHDQSVAWSSLVKFLENLQSTHVIDPYNLAEALENARSLKPSIKN